MNDFREKGRHSSLEARRHKMKARQAVLFETIQDSAYLKICCNVKIIHTLYQEGEFPELHEVTGGVVRYETGYSNEAFFSHLFEIVTPGNYPEMTIRKDLLAIQSELLAIGVEIRSYKQANDDGLKGEMIDELKCGATRELAIGVVANCYGMKVKRLIGLYDSV